MNDLTTTRGRAVPAMPLGWLRSEIDRLFDDYRPARSIFNFASPAPVPALEMTASDKEYRVTVELPGLKQEDFELSVDEGVLTLKGEKRVAEERKDDGYLLTERRYGKFERHVGLPADVAADGISADFDRGVLTITLPRDVGRTDKARKIAVTTGA